MSSSEMNLSLHPKQGQALQTKATELLYGGAAGGGKSYLMRVAAIIWCAVIPGLQVYIFRRIRDDLVKNHMEGPKGFRALLARWEDAGLCQIVEDEIRFWNGSKIYLCHCKDEKDIYKYQGAEIHVLLIDELTHFTESMYRFLRNRVRMVGINLPAKYAGMFPRILCGSNPGNIGHLWVKATFVEFNSPYKIRQTEKSEGRMLRQYIPARLEDNPSMTEDDPGYEDRLEGLGSKELVNAMRWGDWDIIEGAYFDCWHEWKQKGGILRPFKIPDYWIRFRSFDWGSARPFSTGWWAVASTHYLTPDNVTIPKGAIIRYREWYGSLSPNVGLKMTAETVAKGIVERTNEDIAYTTADPSIWSEDGGPSLFERMAGAGLKGLRPADNKRVTQRGAMGGWDMLRQRFMGEDTRPMIYCFDTCTDSIRTIPALQHDEARPEDLDTDGEDHAADEWRYACMSRPYSRPKADMPKAIDAEPLLNERLERHFKRMRQERAGA